MSKTGELHKIGGKIPRGRDELWWFIHFGKNEFVHSYRFTHL